MTTPPTVATTTQGELCPGCDQTDGAHWVTSTPTSDTWTCRHCGTEWTITVHGLGMA